MGALDGVPLLLTAAEAIANKADEQISEILKLMDEQRGQTSFVNGLRVTTVEIEVAAVGTFSLFEARMQHHIPRGPFFRQLRERLEAAGRADLSDRLHVYYLAVNVLKHGRGASYDELLAIPDLPFALKRPGDSFFDEGDIAEPEGLVDVRSARFFAGLAETLRGAWRIDP